MTVRTIGQVATERLSVRILLEPIIMPTGLPQSGSPTAEENPLGVQPYIHPMAKRDAEPKWYRVLGIDEHVECESTVFIFASVPEVPDSSCSLENVVHTEVPRNAEISFVELHWGESLLQRQSRCDCDSKLAKAETIYSKRMRYRHPTWENPDRKCKGTLVVQVSHPRIAEIIEDCKYCVKVGEAASIIGGIAAAYYGPTGIAPAAITSFKTAFWTCLKAQGILWAFDVKIAIKMTQIKCD